MTWPSRCLLILSLVAYVQWAKAVLALIWGRLDPWDMKVVEGAVVITVLVHAANLLCLWWPNRRPTPGRDPAWASVQVEKHRRKGSYFAGWGLFGALSWFLVRPWSVTESKAGWTVGLWVAGSSGFQPVMMIAEVMVIDARIKLGRLFSQPRADGLIEPR